MELMTDNNFSQSLEFGKSLISGNKLDEALNWFVEMSKNFYNKEEVHFELGKIYYILQQYENAKREFEFIKNTQKNNYDFELLLAKVYRALNIDFTALKILLRLYDKYKNEEIEHEIITTLLLNKKFVLAIKFLLENNKDNKNLNGILHDFLIIVSRKVADNRFYKIKDSIIKLMRLFDIHTKQNEFLKVKNILLNEFEIGNKEVVLKSKPRKLTAVLTNKCNLKCKMCKVWCSKPEYEIDTYIIDEIIKIFPYLENIVWVGGEVFLYPNFQKLFEEADKYEIKQNVATNGLLLTEDTIRQICNYNFELNFSIDSIKENTYENIRVGAKFEDLIHKLELINKYMDRSNIKIMMNAVISKWNLNENFLDFILFAKKYNFSKVSYVIDVADENNELLINNFNKNFRYEITELALKYNIEVFFAVPEFVPNQQNNIEKKTFCLKPWKSLFIDYDKIIRPDCFCKATGDLYNSSVMKNWNNDNIVQFRKDMLAKGNLSCRNLCSNNVLDFQRFQM